MRCPTARRTPRRFSRALLTVSTPRIRTWTEKDSSSIRIASAASAPPATASRTTLCASSR